ncbi:SRPBCC family protein [Tahibacter amnicola]|uniref:SRPBCC family protein n=1 Tax=Tahibacter amnicola TaxID=2976241 RepID=A0ABY6B7F9_9GAMM|nr:SRPBCC family protein [Tahibacter amnicola]UXI65819.1 SRPBCC family protein [Tahibacter amnicola]
MPLHTSRTLLKATPQDAFDYLTTPACWHEWHPASVGTEPDTRVPQPKGAAFEENIRTAGFRRRLSWRVVEVRRPFLWEAVATINDGSSVCLRYEFAPDNGGTAFTRTLQYTVKPLWLRLIDTVIGRFRIRMETTSALRRLQQRFEQALVAGPDAVARDP